MRVSLVLVPMYVNEDLSSPLSLPPALSLTSISPPPSYSFSILHLYQYTAFFLVSEIINSLSPTSLHGLPRSSWLSLSSSNSCGDSLSSFHLLKYCAAIWRKQVSDQLDPSPHTFQFTWTGDAQDPIGPFCLKSALNPIQCFCFRIGSRPLILQRCFCLELTCGLWCYSIISNLNSWSWSFTTTRVHV